MPRLPLAAGPTLLLLLFTFSGLLACGCSSDDLGVGSETVPPMTDTVAIYQVHGIRFAVPDGLVPVTNRYVFTDLEPGEDPTFDPYNEITLFVDEERSPAEIIDDVMDGFDNLYDGPHLHNQRRTLVNGRIIRQATITYVPRSRRYPDEPEDTVRIDYALILDEASGETWGFRLIPPDTRLSPEVAQDWADMLNSVEAAPQTDAPLRIGFEMHEGQRRFRTQWCTLKIPRVWRTANSFFFTLDDLPSREQLRTKNIEAIRQASISVSTSFIPHDEKRRTVEDAQNFLDSFGDKGCDTIQLRSLDGYPVEWSEIGLECRSENRVESAFTTAAILINEEEKHIQDVEVEAAFQYVIYTTTEESEPPKKRKELMDRHLQVYESIEIGYR